ncbi:hypothetical protein COE36_27080 [Bacillus cereus]|nr:hypothetical protein COJ82_30155 [Bacillus cereus]PFS48771.1 hypothetical protein COK44_10750 [Bacillus cereus]PGX53695.1 hypothetical protein COE29_20260 [Bacillus cereus]PGY81153.1 hypothetical protein COE36_27080 [Bacillus cereus]
MEVDFPSINTIPIKKKASTRYKYEYTTFFLVLICILGNTNCGLINPIIKASKLNKNPKKPILTRAGRIEFGIIA